MSPSACLSVSLRSIASETSLSDAITFQRLLWRKKEPKPPEHPQYRFESGSSPFPIFSPTGTKPCVLLSQRATNTRTCFGAACAKADEAINSMVRSVLIIDFAQTSRPGNPLPVAPFRFRLKFFATLRLNHGAGSGLPCAGLLAFAFLDYETRNT